MGSETGGSASTEGDSMIDESADASKQTVFTDTDRRNAYTEYHHHECGKVWEEKPDDNLPNYCPGCGVSIYDE